MSSESALTPQVITPRPPLPGGEGEEEAGFTVSVLAPGQAESRLAKRALDGWLTEQGRAGVQIAWEEAYQALMEERGPDGRLRWDWRKALYIAWHCLPRSQREPATLTQLADLLGVRASTMRKWRLNDPEILERIRSLPLQLVGDRLPDVLAANAELAATPDPRTFQDRRLYLELVGAYAPRADVTVDGELDIEHRGGVSVYLPDNGRDDGE